MFKFEFDSQFLQKLKGIKMKLNDVVEENKDTYITTNGYGKYIIIYEGRVLLEEYDTRYEAEGALKQKTLLLG